MTIGSSEIRNNSRQKRGEAAIWQRRFWEHLIRDQEDLSHHIEYVHYNPVKHGYVEQVENWPWSSFHEYVKKGIYSSKWSVVDNKCFDMDHDN